ncbi:unnamed protein product [Clonostachys byssicola]|uniref:Uncharacterized protein n=1 Tax=Clonostachys byssicola TaxID=160290 RepID=A0A9N9UZN8_9HYPO|nr:unnamed protein product [Clonostachys byssicola]
MQKAKESAFSNKMLSFAPTPIPSEHWGSYRPAVPSPLSSSPIRASSPLSPIETNYLPQRQVQSSPIQQPKFKYASRPARRNPVVRRREDAQEMRRKNFLQSVRQKSEDKAWLRRDVEGQLLKASFLARLELSAEGAPEISEADIDDAVAFHQQTGPSFRNDDMMVDSAADEEAELEAMVASYQDEQAEAECASSEMSDEEYDQLFAEFVAHEEQLQQQQQQYDQQQYNQVINHGDAMDEDDEMIF